MKQKHYSISNEKVAEIKALYLKTGATYPYLAAKFGVNEYTVRAITNDALREFMEGM